MASNKIIRIGYLAFNGMQALDLFGPLDAFEETNEVVPTKSVCYENIVVTQDGEPIKSSSGVMIHPHASINDHDPFHTLIIPGGFGARSPEVSAQVFDWIRQIEPALVRFGSICTGLFLLARTGLLDGQKVTTHWQHIDEAQSAFPALEVVPDALFLREQKTFTAAGVTSGIDLALSLIEEDHGPSVASEVARHLVVFFKRPGDQRQYSNALKNQVSASDEFADLIAWVNDNLAEDLSSFALAERVGLSERQFRRRFAQSFNDTPTRYIERLRVEFGSHCLANERMTIEAISKGAGFNNPDTFRRTFERLKSVTPSEYRSRFGRSVV